MCRQYRSPFRRARGSVAVRAASIVSCTFASRKNATRASSASTLRRRASLFRTLRAVSRSATPSSTITAV
jgi:hypothetical protein